MYNNKVKGCIFGLAIGDAIGLRYENVKPANINENNIGEVCFCGDISDDTEHMILISNFKIFYKINIDIGLLK